MHVFGVAWLRRRKLLLGDGTPPKCEGRFDLLCIAQFDTGNPGAVDDESDIMRGALLALLPGYFGILLDTGIAKEIDERGITGQYLAQIAGTLFHLLFDVLHLRK